MKFAKELERDLVPEWRIKYLNYKQGKKHVKSVARAIRSSASATPGSVARRSDIHRTPSFFGSASPFTTRSGRRDRDAGSQGPRAQNADERSPLRPSPAPLGRSAGPASQSTPALPISGSASGRNEAATGHDLQYGSFVATPPKDPPGFATESRNTFELPGPAMRVPSNSSEPSPHVSAGGSKGALKRAILTRSASMMPSIPGGEESDRRRESSIQLPNPALGGVAASTPPAVPGRLRRLFSASPGMRGGDSAKGDIVLQPFDLVREREREFFAFLDTELGKIETFYRQREDMAGRRLDVLKEQLHEMRNQRTHELYEARRRKEREEGGVSGGASGGDGSGESSADGAAKVVRWMDPIRERIFKPGPNSKALQAMDRTPVFAARDADVAGRDARRDYSRRPHDSDVPYRTAKRKLKLALQEFYRSLELLKSYALLNRTAFRKLNKKYDKAVRARPPYRYMNEKVTKAWFVKSDVLDGHISAVEDLYARYFEKGNHKVAAGKLRSLGRGSGDGSASAFRNGLFVATGAVFAIQGLVAGTALLFDEDGDEDRQQQASYLLQIYAGYFLMLYLFVLFCLDCCIWGRNKINYPFIFELDPRHHLDWRQMAEFPCFFFMLFGVCLWLNFSGLGSPDMFLYYPVLLILVSAVVILFPAPVLGHKSRKWFAHSHYRLLLAGIFPVEFRDFFLGDIYCSLTYATSNIALFFCLYSRHWDDPVQCNSNNSRLLGFLSALPPLLRFFQCLRRYIDTRNVFPHLVNGGKYTMSIMAAVTLSMYRINPATSNMALFILFSAINAIYCSFWDLFMDFSLLQPDAKHFLLRNVRALKQRWPYYGIIIVDPILRFGWIFYAIFTHDKQHSTLAAFLIAFAEVTRRGMWTIFRVENEHCANVAQYKAYRDLPLPYRLEHESAESSPLMDPRTECVAAEEATATSTGVRVASSTAAAPGSAELASAEEGTVRRRRMSTTAGPAGSIRRMMAEAHRQDFEKRRRPEGGDDDIRMRGEDVPSDDDDEEDEDEEDEDEEQIAEEVEEAEDLAMRGQQGDAAPR